MIDFLCAAVAAGVNIPESLLDMALKQFDFNFQPKIRYGLRLERTYSEIFEYQSQIYLLENLLNNEDY